MNVVIVNAVLGIECFVGGWELAYHRETCFNSLVTICDQ